MSAWHVEPQTPQASRSRWLCLLARYDQAAPRYGSYPSAEQFTAPIAPETYADWLGGIDQAATARVAISLPSPATPISPSVTTDFVQSLIDELALVESAVSGRLTITELRLRGGVANRLSRDDLVRLFAALRHVFSIRPAARIAASLDLPTLTEAWVRAAVFHGLVEADIRIDAHDLDASTDASGSARLAQAVGWLRTSGVDRIRLDLDYGGPSQRARDIAAAVRELLTLAPDEVVLTRARSWADAGGDRPASAAFLAAAMERLDEHLAACAILMEAGYQAVGPDHFVLGADLGPDGQGAGGVLIGLGPRAVTRLDGACVRNLVDEVAWRAALATGRLPVDRGLILTPEDRLRSAVIEALMTRCVVDLPRVCAAHDLPGDHLAPLLVNLRGLERDGLVRIEAGRITVLDLGRPFLSVIARTFDERATPEADLTPPI